MRIFGSISELVDLAFRLAGGKQVKIRANTQTTSGTLVTVNVPDVVATGDTQNMLLTAATQTMTNKTLGLGTVITAGTINGAIIGGSTPVAGTFTDIVGSTLDINTSAELQTLKIPSLATPGILHNDALGAVSSSLIVNADVDAGAALAFSKLATLASGNVLVGSNTGVPTSRAVTGDVTIDNLGATTIGATKVLNSMLAGSIDRSKLLAGTAYRILANNASGVASENAALTANEAVATDANGQLVSVTGVSATELGYLSGVTSDVQTQINSKQASDATLTAIAGVTTAADKYIYFDGVDTAQAGTITSFGRSLIDDADAATSRSTLGLGSMATQAASSVAITGGTVRGVALDNLRVESDSAAIAAATLSLTKGLMLITAGENTLATLTPAGGFNSGGGAVLTLINNEGADVTVTNAGNIQTGTGADFTLKQGAAASFIFSTTLSKWVLSGGAGGAGGSDTSKEITQANSFAVGDVIYLSGSTYVKARADAANTSETVGMVSKASPTKFTVTELGYISDLSGLTPGEVYFLSPTTAGALTVTEPSVLGQVSKPMLIADTATSGYVLNYRGVTVGGTNARTQLSLLNNTANQAIQNVSAYDAGELTGWVLISGTASQRFQIKIQFAKNAAGSDYNVAYQVVGDTPPVGFAVGYVSPNITVSIPSVAGFSSANINYALNAPAVGATFPLTIDGSNVTLATASVQGAYKAGQAPGQTTGVAIAAGYIGEVVNTASPLTAGTLNITTLSTIGNGSLPLTPGAWELVYDLSIQTTNGATTAAPNFSEVLAWAQISLSGIEVDSSLRSFSNREVAVSSVNCIMVTNLRASAFVNVGLGGATYTVQAAYSIGGAGSGTVSLVNSGNSKSRFYARRIA